jgi:hypothetical protein
VKAQSSIDIKDLQGYYQLVTIKGALMPIQAEIMDKEHPPAKDLAETYDGAANAFNKAQLAWKSLQSAKELGGKNEGKLRDNFNKLLTVAFEMTTRLMLKKGVVL